MRYSGFQATTSSSHPSSRTRRPGSCSPTSRLSSLTSDLRRCPRRTPPSHKRTYLSSKGNRSANRCPTVWWWTSSNVDL